MNTAVREEQGYLSWQEFINFQEEQEFPMLWELVNGVPVCLASPSGLHQDICGEVFNSAFNYFKGKECRALTQRDVVLDESKDAVYIPDMIIVCNREQEKGKYIAGPPTLIVEIWLPSNSRKEIVRKRKDYLEFGVQEFWEFYPDSSHAIKSTPTNRETFLFEEKMTSTVFPGLVFDLSGLDYSLYED